MEQALDVATQPMHLCVGQTARQQGLHLLADMGVQVLAIGVPFGLLCEQADGVDDVAGFRLDFGRLLLAAA